MIRVHCPGCATTYVMPEHSKPHEVATWTTLHVAVCPNATGVQKLGVDDDDEHEQVRVTVDHVRRAVERARDRREADVAAIDTVDARLQEWVLSSQTSTHPAFATDIVDDCRRAVLRTLGELRSHLSTMRRRALQSGHHVDVDRRPE